MKRTIRKSFSEGVVAITLSLLFVNTAFADSSVDRLAAYKANKLVPANVSIKVGREKNSEATFITFQRTWATAEYGNLANLVNTFAEWNLEDFQNYDWLQHGTTMNEAYFNYMTKVETGEIIPECSGLTKDLAMDLKMGAFSPEQIDYGAPRYNLVTCTTPPPAFEFSGNEQLCKYLERLDSADLSNCTGLTLEQLYDVGISNTPLPPIQVKGTEDFSRLSMEYMDLTRLKGLTVEQILQFKKAWIPGSGFEDVQLNGSEDFSHFGLTGDISGWKGITKGQCLQALSTGNVSNSKWPTVTFEGTEDFSKANLQYINFNLGSFKGITAEQFTSSASLYRTTLPEIDFTGVKGFTQNIKYANLTRCTGLTADQITSAKDWSYIEITQAQYDSMKDGLSASLLKGKRTTILVDGKYTTIRSSN